MQRETFDRSAKPRQFFARALRVGFVLALLAASVLLPARAYSSDAPGAKATQSDAPGFLVVAADRGFLGNEEIRDAFAAFAPGRNAELAFVTDQRTQGTLEQAFQELARRSAQRVVALPLFLSAADPRLSLAMKLMSEPSGGISGLRLPVSWARPFGESYLAVEALADRFRAITRPQGRRVVVVGHGAHTRQDRERMDQDWQRIAEHASKGFGFSEVRTLIWFEQRGARAIVIPARTTGRGPEKRFLAGLEFEFGEGFAPHPLFARWVEKQVQLDLAALGSQEAAHAAAAQGEARKHSASRAEVRR